MLRRLGLASARRVEFDSGEQKFGIRVVESYKKNDFPPTREAASLPPCTPQRYGPVTQPELSVLYAPRVGGNRWRFWGTRVRLKPPTE